MFAALGVEVTVVDKRQEVLEFIDREIVQTLMYHMRDLNTIFRLGEEVSSVEATPANRAVARLESGKRITSDVLLYSVGRQGATAELNLEAAGLRADVRGRLTVNDRFQTAQRHILAVGDVIGFPSLASTSMEQGRTAICNAFGVKHSQLQFLEISMVGETEETLTESGVPYEVGLARFKEIARGSIVGDNSGLLKIIFHIETRRILGVHILGTGAAELIHIGQAVMALGGNLDYFVDGVFNYPTLAECYKVAALDGFNKVVTLEGERSQPVLDGIPAGVP